MKRLLLNFPRLMVTCILVLSITVSSAQKKAKSSKGKGLKKGHTKMMMTPITDTGFLSKNIRSNMMEIHMSEAGRDRGNKEMIRAAEMMIKDHTQILTDLTTIAGRLGVVVPEDTDMNMAMGDNMNAKLFNITWTNQMLTMHKAKVKELEMAIPQLKDPALKAAASSALPKVKLHTQMLEKIKQSIRK